jgi:hypothetical protein
MSRRGKPRPFHRNFNTASAISAFWMEPAPRYDAYPCTRQGQWTWMFGRVVPFFLCAVIGRSA